jgi:hypothetical protein
MSDEPKALPARRPGVPGAPGAARPAGARPAAKPPADSAGSLRLRKMLLLGILLACLGLGGAIVWKLFGPKGQSKSAVDADVEFEKAEGAAKEASNEIFRLESKVWVKNEELSADDLAVIKTKLEELRLHHDKLKDLLDLLRAKGLSDSGSYQKIVPKWIQLKMWIQDASDLLANPKPPDYGGLNIPMYVTGEKIKKAQTELGEIFTIKEKIKERNDPAEIKATRKKVADLREAFRSHVAKMQALDKYVADELARPDLTHKEVRELENLREEANKAQMAIKMAGTLLQELPE